MHGVRFITLVIETPTVPSMSADLDGIRLRKGFSVDGPVVHPVVACEFLAEHERHDAARRLRSIGLVAKNSVIPGGLSRRRPLRGPAAVRVFHDDAQPGIPRCVFRLAEDP